MNQATAQFTLLLAVAMSLPAQGQNRSEAVQQPLSFDAPLYRISFQRGDAVPGIGAMSVIKLPFECTSDGTVFISMLQPVGVGSRPHNLAPFSLSLLLTSISLSGGAHSFPLDQAPDLYDVTEIDHYASDSKVVFLVNAAPQNKQEKQRFGTTDGEPGEFTRNAAEHHFYIVTFDRQGNYQETVQIADAFQITQLGLFPSGIYLAYGYEEPDHSPKLAMLKDDGTLLKYLQIPKGDAPASALGTLNGSGKGSAVYIASAQFVGQGQSIYLVQIKTDFPVLEVSDGGAVRVIHTKLPKGIQIKMLLPSDENLFVLANEMRDSPILELSAQDGRVLKRFHLSNNESGADVACVHDGKFLSFEHGGGSLIPLMGAVEPGQDAK